MQINLSANIGDVIANLRGTATSVDKQIARKLVDIGLLVQREARDKYAPIWNGMKGGLMSCIAVGVAETKDAVSIYVGANTAAGKYARWLHETQGWKLGKRSLRKAAMGNPVGPKYIERAAMDNLDKIQTVMEGISVENTSGQS